MSTVKRLAAATFVIMAVGIAYGQTASDSRAHAAQQKATTQAAANHTSVGITKEQADAILGELRQIRLLLEKQQQLLQAATPLTAAPVPALQEVKVSADGGYSLGRGDAGLILVEFADYQCPYCRQFHTTVFAQLKKDYIDTGKLRFVSRDLPLDSHASAFKAAQAARCAGDQDQFWQMRDLLIAHSDALNDDSILTSAQRLGLDVISFRSCLSTGKYLPAIRRDIADASSVGITATPSFVLGRISGGMVEGGKIIGTQSYSQLEKLLNDYSAKRIALAGQRP